MLRILAIIAISAAVYTYQLDRVPAFLTLDEAHFSVHAHAIATTGKNLNGDILPALISLEDPEGEPIHLPWGHTHYLPFGFYLIAGALQLLPLNEFTVRLPSALLGGVVNVALIYFAALALFRERRAAVWSAAILAFTPANVIISRQAIDTVCQLPFTLGFLWCLGRYLQSPQPRYALAAGVILGAGIYAYVTSIVFMPLFLVLFWFIPPHDAKSASRGPRVAWHAGVFHRRAWSWSLAGFAAALAPMLLWLLFHPDAFASIRMQYNRADPGSATLMETIANGGAGAALRELIRIYWSYFDPAFLFVQGGNARTLSTGEVGVFLVPVAILAAWGLWALRAQRNVWWLLLIVLIAAPLPAAIKGTPYQIQRASGLLIVVSLLAGFGFASLWAAAGAGKKRRWGTRAMAVVLAVVMAWQFDGFYRDYLGNYRVRSAAAFDPTAFKGAAELIISEDQRDPINAVYLPLGFYDVGAKWRFYTTTHDRPALWRRTHYFSDVAALATAASGAVAVIPAPRSGPNGWTTTRTIRNPMGEETLSVIRR